MYSNETEDDDYSIRNSDFSKIYHTSCIVLATLGLLGNLLVILLVVVKSKMRTVTNIHILNLSVFDCFIMVALFLRHLQLSTEGARWCRFYLIVASIADFGGCLAIAALSLDRCFAICFILVQLKYRTTKNTVFACLVVWFICILVSVPMVYYGEFTKYEDDTECSVHFGGIGSDFGYRIQSIYEFTLQFALPFIVIAVSYVTILTRLSGMNFRVKNSKRKRKVTVFVVVVIGVYLTLWLPYWCTELYFTFGPQTSYGIKYVIFAITGIISYLHSAINPLLYAFLSDDFKVGFSELILCKRISRHTYGSRSSRRGGKSSQSKTNNPEFEEELDSFSTRIGSPEGNVLSEQEQPKSSI